MTRHVRRQQPYTSVVRIARVSYRSLPVHVFARRTASVACFSALASVTRVLCPHAAPSFHPVHARKTNGRKSKVTFVTEQQHGQRTAACY